ncbi:homocysteine-responsive endoplasmic reticulum-resident ubiquitin-like domain member 2 protein isoform X2 [Musca domestica]|nr:homocysteine-responsive endoplasmic reticulum-resident ubiquitin-like domain member 2 protein isoform X2 [Musca domestica]
MDVAPTNKSPSYVKLLIKASNQQYDDQIIESDLSWTVKRLKSHLALVYPSKPPVADQKLIYSGQLLNDNLQLKDVIRSYKDVYTHNHIIHLVYTPKNLPPVPPAAATLKKSKPTSSTSPGSNSMASEDGIRQRHTSSSVGNTSTNQNGIQNQRNPMGYYSQYMPQSTTTSGGAGPPLTVPDYSQYNMQALAMQQAAMYTWMQQVYTQYMEQCLRASNNLNGTSDDGNRTALPPFSAFPQNPFLPQFPQTVIHSVAPNTTMTANTVAEQQQPAQEPEQQPAQAQVAAPRFPNMPQEEADNRDWLDNIFSITRLALFLTILYFNSSPLRCLAVVIIAGGIYLYHIGVFRFRHERNNNNLNRNNNAVQNAAVDQIRQGVGQQQPQEEQANAAPENNVNENNGDAPAAVVNNTDQPANANNSNAAGGSEVVANDNNESMISTLRTFVVTFFTSLLPETPAI